MPSMSTLEKLPFLTAVLTEGLRTAHGTAGRLARIAPDEDLVCHGLKIPRGTTMSQSNYLIHTDPAVYPDPYNFHPERFLGNSEATTEARKNFVPFGKGMRMCVGMNLAWAELYLTVAALLTSVEMELVDTTARDALINAEYVYPWRYKRLRHLLTILNTIRYFAGALPADSKGIRVRVLGKL